MTSLTLPDLANGIERHPFPSQSATKALPYPSVSVRSSRILPPKSSIALRVATSLTELGLSQRLIMPTKTNIDKFDALQTALGQMIELKKAVDRIEGEMRMMKKRKEGILGGGTADASQAGDAEGGETDGQARTREGSQIADRQSERASSVKVSESYHVALLAFC